MNYRIDLHITSAVIYIFFPCTDVVLYFGGAACIAHSPYIVCFILHVTNNIPQHHACHSLLGVVAERLQHTTASILPQKMVSFLT